MPAWTLSGIEANTAHLSVPTRFLKSWIQSHYTDRVLACWQGENAEMQKIEVSVRSAVIRTAPPKLKPPEIAEPHRDPGSAGSTSVNCAPSMRRSRPGTMRSAVRRSICG